MRNQLGKISLIQETQEWPKLTYSSPSAAAARRKNKNNGAETKHGEDKQKKEGTSDTHDFKSLGEVEEVNDDDEAWRENEKQRGL